MVLNSADKSSKNNSISILYLIILYLLACNKISRSYLSSNMQINQMDYYFNSIG